MSINSSRPLMVNGISAATYNELMFPIFEQDHPFQYFYRIICNFLSRIEFAAYTWRWPTDHYLIDKFSQGIERCSAVKTDNIFRALISFDLQRVCNRHKKVLRGNNPTQLRGLIIRLETDLANSASPERTNLKSFIKWDPDHFQQEVVGVKIPTADPSIDIKEWKKLFKEAGLKEGIDDEGIKWPLEICKKKFFAGIENLALGSFTNYGKPATTELVLKSQNILRLLITYVREKNDPNVLQDIVKRIAGCFFHCTDRLATELVDLMLDYPLKDQANIRAEQLSIKNQLHRWLYFKRFAALQFAAIFSEDRHPAATHRYYRKVLGSEFGIKDELAATGADWESCAVRDREDTVRERFHSAYNIFTIAEQFAASILDGSNKEVTFTLFNQWFIDKGLSQDDFLIMDEEDPTKIKIKTAAVLLFFNEMEVIDPI